MIRRGISEKANACENWDIKTLLFTKSSISWASFFFVIRNYVLIHMNMSVGQKRMVNTVFKKKNILMGEWKGFVANSII